MSFLGPVASYFSLLFVYIYLFFIRILRQSCISLSKSRLINDNKNFLTVGFAALTVVVANFIPLNIATLILANWLSSFCWFLVLFKPLVISLGSLSYQSFSLSSINHMIIDIYFRNPLLFLPFVIFFSILVTIFSPHFLFTYLLSTSLSI